MTKDKQFKLMQYGAMALLFVLAFMMYLNIYFYVRWDLGQYIANATSFLNGHGFVNFIHQPENLRAGYILFLAAVLAITGGSVKAVMFTIISYSALLSVLVFAVTRSLSNFRTGLLVALLWILTPALVWKIPILLDSLWPVFFLLAVLSVFAFEKKSDKALLWGVVCGFMLCCVISVKAASLPLMLFPAIYIFVVPIRFKHRLQFLFACYTLLVVSALVFEYYFSNIRAESALSDSFYYPAILLKDPTLTNLIAFVKALFMGVYGYFYQSTFSQSIMAISTLKNKSLSEYIPLVTPMLLSLGYITLFAWQRNKRWFSLPIIFMLCLPHMCVAGLYTLRMTQNIVVIAVLYIALGLCVNDLISRFLPKLAQKENWIKCSAVLGVLLIALLCSNFFFLKPDVERPVLRNMKSLWVFHMTRDIRVDLRGDFLPALLPDYANNDYQALVQDPVVAKGFYIASQGVKPVNTIPYHKLDRYKPNDSFIMILSRDQTTLAVLNYSLLKDMIEKNKIRYIALYSRNELVDWLKQFDGVSLYKTAKDNGIPYSIFEVKENWPEQWDKPIMITSAAQAFIKDLKANNMKRYAWLVENYSAMKLFDDAATEKS